jgi:hypothetical protein
VQLASDGEVNLNTQRGEIPFISMLIHTSLMINSIPSFTLASSKCRPSGQRSSLERGP